MNIKGQSALEFFILVGAVLFFFVIFLSAIQGVLDKQKADLNNQNFENIAQIVKEEIGFASSSTDGYYRYFEVPDKINGLDYDIRIIEGSVYLNSTIGKYSIALSVDKVQGDIVRGINLISKNSGVVYLNS